MAEIESIKIWRSTDKKDRRVYVNTSDGRSGCIYRTGNHWHKAGEIDGNLTEDEWQAARDLALQDGKWHSIASWEMKAGQSSRCPDCGGYDCGPNCNANASQSVKQFSNDYQMMESGTI